MPKCPEWRLVSWGLAAFAIWIFVALPLLYGASGWLSTETYQYRNSDDGRQSTPQNSEPSPPDNAGTVTPKPHPDSGLNYKDECHYGGPDWFAPFYCFFAAHDKFWVSFGTLILASGTGILGFATVFLWMATNRLVRGAEKTAERQLRAYVHLRNAHVLSMNDSARRSVRVAIENFGQTPANDVIFWMGVHVQEWPLTTRLDRGRPNIPVGVEPLAARGFRHQDVEVDTLSAWENGELQAGRAGIYAWGEITYRDIFGSPQRTWFRIVCEGDGLADGLMHATEEGNGAT